MSAVSPATLQIMPNEHYGEPEDYTLALAEAIREEYGRSSMRASSCRSTIRRCVDIYDWWFSLNDDIDGYRKWAAFQVEAMNHALRGHPRGPRPLPHLLGQLARPAHARRAAEGRRRPAAAR